MSRMGGCPKRRLYSRLNWLGLSYPTSKAALAASRLWPSLPELREFTSSVILLSRVCTGLTPRFNRRSSTQFSRRIGSWPVRIFVRKMPSSQPIGCWPPAGTSSIGNCMTEGCARPIAPDTKAGPLATALQFKTWVARAFTQPSATKPEFRN